MSSYEEKPGFMGQIRKLSRRLSATLLDAQKGQNLLGQRAKNSIYSHDSDSNLRINGVPAAEIVEKYGTPTYVYDANRIVDNYYDYLGSLQNINNFMLCYPVKANPNISLLHIFKTLGAGFDVVSGGEIARCLAADVDPSKIVFSGCGKSVDEIEYAVEKAVFCINVESWSELERIEAAARKYNKIQNIAIRVNPHVSQAQEGHQFGVSIADAMEIYSRAKASAYLKCKGISCHIGCPLNQLEPFIEARDKLLALADELRQESRIWIEHINLGGGFAAQIANAAIPVSEMAGWVERLAKPITDRGLRMVLEPGRSLVADAGVLLTRVEYVKRFNTAGSGPGSRKSSLSGSPSTRNGKETLEKQGRAMLIMDAGFNDFARVALYGAQHYIVPGSTKYDPLPGMPSEFRYDVVGPLCENVDVFAKDLVLPVKVEPGAILGICDVGAYGMSMTSNYNGRRRPNEVLISDGEKGQQFNLIRRQEPYEEQFQNDILFTELQIKSLKIPEEAEHSDELQD